MAKTLKTTFRGFLTYSNMHYFQKLGLAILLIVSLGLALVMEGNAKAIDMKRPKFAVIHSHQKPSKDNEKFFQINRPGSSEKKPVANGARIAEGRNLSVPNDATAWAKFFFLDERNEKAYGGLIVQTRAIQGNRNNRYNSYFFPCTYKGAHIIALSSKTKACGSTKDGGLRLDTAVDPKGVLKDKRKDKQNSRNEQISGDLIINPGQGRTVIQTSVDGTANALTYKEVCTEEPSDSKPISAGGAIQLPSTIRKCKNIPLNIESNIVRIEVLEGDIFVKTDSDTEGEKVSQNQEYIYPRENPISPIDSAAKANTCETLRFLNAAYWSPDTPKSIFDDIAEQLRQHREALGVSGRPPKPTSPLVQEIFDAMNRERNSKGLPPLSLSKGMSSANNWLVTDQEGSGKYSGHVGTQSISTGERLGRYGSVGCAKYDEDEFENIIYFEQLKNPTAQEIVNKMLSNERLRYTGMKSNLFNKDFQVAGVACGSKMCVISYAEGYLEGEKS
jgi:uncharacterized protein YkwD